MELSPCSGRPLACSASIAAIREHPGELGLHCFVLVFFASYLGALRVCSSCRKDCAKGWRKGEKWIKHFAQCAEWDAVNNLLFQLEDEGVRITEATLRDIEYATVEIRSLQQVGPCTGCEHLLRGARAL